MSFWEAVVYGIVQGLTEFLPVSSSAHLRIVGALRGAQADPGAAFTAIIQIGTAAAITIYFRHDIARIAKGWWQSVWNREKSRDATMGWLIIVGTIPIAVLGLVFKDTIETGFRNLYLIAAVLILFGILLGVADRYGRRRKAIDDLGMRDGVVFGLAQALALIPGVSRSGSTITAGLALGYTREASTRYAFLLSTPAIVGSGLYELLRAAGERTAYFPGWGATFVATVVSFAVGYVVVIVFLKLVSYFSYRGFVWYRAVVGVAVLAMLLLKVMEPLPAVVAG